jgi:hypothetical protein
MLQAHPGIVVVLCDSGCWIGTRVERCSSAVASEGNCTSGEFPLLGAGCNLTALDRGLCGFLIGWDSLSLSLSLSRCIVDGQHTHMTLCRDRCKTELDHRPGALIYGGFHQGSVYITSSVEVFFERMPNMLRLLCRLSVNAGAEWWQAGGCVGLAGLWIFGGTIAEHFWRYM